MMDIPMIDISGKKLEKQHGRDAIFVAGIDTHREGYRVSVYRFNTFTEELTKEESMPEETKELEREILAATIKKAHCELAVLSAKAEEIGLRVIIHITSALPEENKVSVFRFVEY